MISLCTSFVIVCKGFETTRPDGGIHCLGNMTAEQMVARQTHLLPLEVSRSIAFLRIWVRRRRPRNALTPRRPHRTPLPPVMTPPFASPPLLPPQCLAEVMAAIKAMLLAGMAVVMKTGRLNGRKFEPDDYMTHAIQKVVDVSQAKATKPSDEQMILHDGPEGQPEEAAAKYKSQKEGVPDGFEGINAVVRSFVGASRVCMGEPEVQAAACGDDSLDMERASKQQLAEWAVAAAGGGYVGLLRRLLAHGAPVDVVVKGGLTAVMAAAMNGQLEALRLLLAAPGGEAAVNQQDPGSGIHSLASAASSGCTAEARLLLQHGADPNLADNDGNSPLIRAAMASGDAGRGVAALLLDAEAEIDHQSKEGATALYWACALSNVQVAKLLLERGANTMLKHSNGKTAERRAESAVRKEELLALLARY